MIFFPYPYSGLVDIYSMRLVLNMQFTYTALIFSHCHYTGAQQRSSFHQKMFMHCFQVLVAWQNSSYCKGEAVYHADELFPDLLDVLLGSGIGAISTAVNTCAYVSQDNKNNHDWICKWRFQDVFGVSFMAASRASSFKVLMLKGEWYLSCNTKHLPGA